MIVIIDNYDSFTYNLYQEIGEIYPDISVVRNDEVTIEKIQSMNPDAVVISPGPGYPSSAGISIDAVKYFSGKIPVLGVCLGHQSIIEAFGGEIIKADEIMHGKASDIRINTKSKIFKNLPDTIKVARYHSLIGNKLNLPDCLEIIAEDENGQIMAVKHKSSETYGLQFHPESILTETGKIILSNFIRMITEKEIPEDTLKPLIAKVADGINLTESEAEMAMDCIMSGNATNIQISGFLTALRMKGETIDEITGLAKGMRSKATQLKDCTDSVDIVGTGGDLANTFNISTTSSFVIASSGIKVAKHGNRSVSSKSGAADVLESLGAEIASTPEQARKLIQNTGLSFLFAQSYHPAMKYVASVRRDLGIRTVFNILGPLCNPANTDYIILGVYDKLLLEPMAEVIRNIGIKSAMIVYGNDKLDEVSVSDITSVCEVRNGQIKSYDIKPEDFGLNRADKSEIVGGTADDNAEITKGILSGKIKGAKRDIVIINSACAMYICGKSASIKDGVKLAQNIIDSGKAYDTMQNFIKATHEV